MAQDVDQYTGSCLDFLRQDMDKELPIVAFQPDRQETEKTFLPVCSDPKEYLEILRGTREYGRMVQSRFEQALKAWKKISRGNKNYDVEVPTLDLSAEAFEETESFKQLFWNFYEKVLHLSYVEHQYPAEVCRAFEEYREAAKREILIFSAPKDKEEMIEVDRERSKKHDQVAEALVRAGIVKTYFVARVLTRAFLVDRGEDWITSARVADQQRVLRSLTDHLAISNFLTTVESQARAEDFSHESIVSIQGEFVKGHPGASFVEKGRFQAMPKLSVKPQGDQENF